jgi:hypothetical protein
MFMDRTNRKKTTKDTLPFHPYFTAKDGFALVCFLVFYTWFVFYVPNYLYDADNYIEANPLQTPAHIVPEWYYLPFFAILRSIPSKLGGTAASPRCSLSRSCPGSTPPKSSRRLIVPSSGSSFDGQKCRQLDSLRGSDKMRVR